MISFFALVVWFLKDWLLALEGRLNLRYNPHIKKPFSKKRIICVCFFGGQLLVFGLIADLIILRQFLDSIDSRKVIGNENRENKISYCYSRRFGVTMDRKAFTLV